MAASDVELLRHAWEAFARGDLTGATDVLDPAVRWYGAEDPDAEGACHNRDDALAFIQRALDDGVTAEPLDIRDAGDRIVVVLQTHKSTEASSSGSSSISASCSSTFARPIARALARASSSIAGV